MAHSGIPELASIRYRKEEAILARSQNPSRENQEHILPIKSDLVDLYICN